ncbi:MAG: hypothetical protein GOV15_02505, partial [Candidatus Diapherotrites archaeon]|nr:hypothetical protein [Candidatus Diapherotrites archaeon]
KRGRKKKEITPRKGKIKDYILRNEEIIHTTESISKKFKLGKTDSITVLNQLERDGEIFRLHWGQGAAYCHPDFVNERQRDLSELLASEGSVVHQLLLTVFKNPNRKYGAGELARASGFSTNPYSQSVRDLAKGKNSPLVRIGTADFQLAEHFRPKPK